MKVTQIKDGVVNSLIIEITRKCNFSCGHCLRGNAQSKDFDVKHLAKFIYDNNVTDISDLTLTGGEPLLVPDIIDEIVQLLRWRDVAIGSYYIATNGSKFTARTLDAIANLHMLCYDNSASNIEVSNSIWHKEDKNYIEYAGGLDDVIERIGYSEIERMRFGTELHHMHMSERSELNWSGKLVSEGRAKDFGSTPMEDTSMSRTTYINVNGDILLNNCNTSFETQEKLIKENK